MISAFSFHFLLQAEISEVFAQLETKRDENGPKPSSSERVHYPRLAIGPKHCVDVRSENRDSNHNTEASICQNVTCASDSVDSANLEATERLLREIVASLPTQQQVGGYCVEQREWCVFFFLLNLGIDY